MINQVCAFEVSVTGTDWTKIINARTAGKAKYQYWLDVTDAWPDVPLTAMRAKKYNGGRPYTSEAFERNAKYRGLPDVKCGQRVRVGNDEGVVVGHNSSANFDVLFDDDSPKYGGQKLNVHPQEIELVESAGGASRCAAEGAPPPDIREHLENFDDELQAMASIGDAFAGFTEEAYGSFIEKYVDAPLSTAQNSTQLAT